MADKTETKEAKPAAAKKGGRQYRLTHHSNKPGYEGLIGDVISVDEAGAEWLDKSGGGFEVDADGVRVVKKAEGEE